MPYQANNRLLFDSPWEDRKNGECVTSQLGDVYWQSIFIVLYDEKIKVAVLSSLYLYTCIPVVLILTTARYCE